MHVSFETSTFTRDSVIVTWIKAVFYFLPKMTIALSVTNSRFNSFNFRSVKCIYCWVKYAFNSYSFLPMMMETA